MIDPYMDVTPPSEYAKTDLDDYSRWTRTTWASGSFSLREQYALVGLGLAGEMCEAIKALQAFWNTVEEVAAGLAQSETRDSVIKEMGDWLYYWARLLDMMEVLPSTVQLTYSAKTDLVGQTPIDRWIYFTGKIVERIKKHVRDGRPLVEGSYDKIFEQLAGAHLAWSYICYDVAISPDEVRAENVDKLESRKARGTIRGEGDNR